MIFTASIIRSIVLISAATLVHAQGSDDEFVGPFPSWSDLQRQYGTGRDALQRALNDIGTTGHSSNLFLPAGTYCAPPLSVASRIGISIVGDDPSTTIVKYCGPKGGILLYLNGIAYSRIGRITFDCGGLADVAIDQSWDGHRDYFDTGNEYADVVFRNCTTGIRGGNLDYGFAETSVLRARFGPSSGTCVILKNFNALDLWIWYSLFDQCFIGITNDPGAGNFHVYNSVFRQSGLADMRIHNTGIFNVRNNTSIGSKAFWITSSAFRHPALVTLQGNALINATSPAIVIGDQGPATLIDNRIQSRSKDNRPVVEANELGDTDLITIGNLFTANNPISSRGRHISIDDKTGVSLGMQEPLLPRTPPNLHRRIFEVPKGATTGEIQRVINDAARSGSMRAVVHFPEGIYEIDNTINIPRDSTLQIVGDGAFATRLEWHGTGGGPVIRVFGPSKSILRELAISGSLVVDALVIGGIDQPGSRVYMQQVQLAQSQMANLFVDGLAYTTVELRDVGHKSAPAVSIKVAGATRGTDASHSATVNVFSGASAANAISYELTHNARLLVRDTWYETASPTGYLRVSGAGTFTIHGSRIALAPKQNPPAFDLMNFHGQATFLSSLLDDRIVSKGDASGSKLFVLGFLGGVNIPSYLLNQASPAGQVSLLASRYQPRPGAGLRTVDMGSADPEFIRKMLAQTRERNPQFIDGLPDGVSDVRLYRVDVGNGIAGIHLLP